MRGRAPAARRGLAICLLAVAAIVSAAGAARAEDPREEARREFAAGQAADRRSDWRGAIEHYLRANDLFPHPFAVYNIAVDYERLDKLREAATWYERYLAGATDAADRERVRRVLAELVTRPARLTVRSVPDGAQVFVDGVPVGTTPYGGTIRGGFHRIGVELDGRRAQRDVTVEYAEPVSVELSIAAAAGTLRVTGAPYGAAISVDGEDAGTIPARLALAAGTHTVRVTRDGYAPYETTVEVAADRETAVDARLSPGTGGAGGRRVLRAAYLFGFGGGLDVRGEGGLGMVELGIRLGPLDASARVGKAAGLTVIDLLLRWTLTRGKLAPFAGGAYTAVEKGGGFALIGGVRYDVVRAERAGVSVLVESGLRYYSGTPESSSGEPAMPDSGFIVPVMASVLVLYK